MGDLTSYAIEDLIPFTLEVYQRLVVWQNHETWPAVVVRTIGGIACAVLACRGRVRVMAALLAAVWGYVCCQLSLRAQRARNTA